VNLSLSQSDDVPPGWLDENTVALLRAAAAGLEPEERTVDMVIVGDERIREINREFRGKDSPTDVISFSYLEEDGPVGEEDIIGEIYVSWETLAREAHEMGVDPGHLFLRIGVHGLLHVIGYEHGTDRQAEHMESEERRILAQHLGANVVDALF